MTKKFSETKRRHIRWQQRSADAAHEAHSKKAGYDTRPKPSMPKMPWDDEPATVERHLARGRAE